MKEINLNHICKIEGHANLSLLIENKKVKKCELKAVEGARFFEALVLNKKVEDIQEIVSRICGICSVAHSVCCIQALEEALGVKPTEIQKKIREILMIGERLRSNFTHLYFLSLPDYLDASSALSLKEKHRDKIEDALKLISLGNKIIETFGGREIHPFLKIEAGFEKKDFSFVIDEIKNIKPLIIKTIELFLGLNYPVFERECSYLSLKDKEYAIISGKVVSEDGKFIDDSYKKHLTENIKEYATSKFVLKDGKPYMLGAIARINNNFEQLDEESRAYLKKVRFPFNNPFHNNIAQAIESLHLANRVIKLIENLEFNEEAFGFRIKEGDGVSAVEAPRGTLFHEYKIDREGKIIYCNIIPPTTQNLNMMEIDIKTLVNSLLSKNTPKEKIVREIEKLIRAYDPCFSCSTHFLKVK